MILKGHFACEAVLTGISRLYKVFRDDPQLLSDITSFSYCIRHTRYFIHILNRSEILQMTYDRKIFARGLIKLGYVWGKSEKLSKRIFYI